MDVPLFAEVPAVVGPEDEDCVARILAVVERVVPPLADGTPLPLTRMVKSLG